MRQSPNIVITGTPGVGKTTHCEILAERTGLRHVSVNEVVKDRGCQESWSEEHQSWIVDEDKVSTASSIFIAGIPKCSLPRFSTQAYPPYMLTSC